MKQAPEKIKFLFFSFALIIIIASLVPMIQGEFIIALVASVFLFATS